MRFQSLISLFFGLTFSLLAQSAELAGVQMPDQLSVDIAGTKKELKLNGIALRTKTFLNVKVYVGGLYLESPVSDTQQILNSNQIKRVETEFMREVDAGKIRDTWKENFETNCGKSCDLHKERFNKFLSILTDVKKGDRMTYQFSPNQIDVFIRNEKKGSFDNDEFGKILLSSWIGEHAPSAEFRQALLGKH